MDDDDPLADPGDPSVVPGPALLLDSHLAHALAAALRRLGFDADHVAHWRGGSLRDADDVSLMRAATHSGRILVTRDTATLPTSAFALISDGEKVSGVMVISSRIRADDVSAQRTAIQAVLAHRPAAGDWQDVVVYAARPQSE
jgi:predicted nuclease of predicted toxin-antitoxin system